MERTGYNGGAVYEIPAEDIEYIGYFYGKNGREDLKDAYVRIGTMRGRKPDFLINCELFDFSTRAPASDVVENGKIHRLTESFGMSFVSNEKAAFSYKNLIGAPDYVGFYPVLLRDRKRAFTTTPAGLAGKRGRTAIAVNKKNDVFLALIPDNNGGATLEDVTQAFIKEGATDGGNLDGGGSSQWYSPGGCIYTGRPLRGFIAIWVKSEKNTLKTSKYNVSIRQNMIPIKRPNRPGKKNSMQYITIHETGNYTKKADANAHANYLRTTSEKVSWHYTVDDKEAVQHLPDYETAFHAGTTAGNTSSIGIEICVNADCDFDKAAKNAAALVRKLRAEHDIPIGNVVQHNYWSGKNCPKSLRKSGWTDFVNMCLANEGGEAEQKTVSVRTVLNIRRDPPNAFGVNLSRVVGTYKNGEKVAVYEKKNGWYRTHRGWCHSTYLK